MWSVEIDERAADELRRIGTADQRRILKFLRERVAVNDDPRRLASKLTGAFDGFWRFRVGNYRLIATIEDNAVCVVILRVGHGREIYR